MRVAFYAPMKPPHHPVPSGDRRMARLLISAMGLAGHEVDLAARFRSWDRNGDPRRLGRLQKVGRGLGRRLIRRYRRPGAVKPEAWFTYHVYYRAPDWIGPMVSSALGIPYIIAEASVSGDDATGPWAEGHAAAVQAIRQADAVIGLNSADTPGVLPMLDDPGRLIMLKPFLESDGIGNGMDAAAGRNAEREALARRFDLDPQVPWLLAVAMMRPGYKVSSYRVLSQVLEKLRHQAWKLVIAGDGPARNEVEACFHNLGPDRVCFTGLLAMDELAELYRASDILTWPAIDEAYGMALLEAQAAGLPVIAGDSHGVGDIVRHGVTGLLTPEGDVTLFADAVDGLLNDATLRGAMGRAALDNYHRYHHMTQAVQTLDAVLAATKEQRLP